ncbi:nitroreductase/quinone reductase family protein [Kribbella qitaiheensis]|uniref:nitroreductase/quinone reductase family protein n=1 Tax=Kribbella qitaiheensis TaxID=1544730 RepID=UPI001FE38277|nr:nitroreductase/quinone reductase family protein [Kribbella qitaiheensis]
MPTTFTEQLITEFRANAGQVSGPFEGARLLLLTTTGARSGKPHTTVLGYYPDTAPRVFVVGSAGGGPKHPDWYHNALANPRVTVETGLFTYEADAVVLRGAERDEIFERFVEADPGWGEYQSKTTRTIPVVALQQLFTGPPGSGGSFADTLRLIHTIFRRELALIRKEFAASGPSLGAQLRINCLTLCQGLHNHHAGESTALFPSLLKTYPELAPTIKQLDADHARIADLLADLQALITTTTAPADALAISTT